MKAVVIPKAGPPEVLSYQDWPEPEPKPGEVRIRTHYAGVNFADTMARLGLYPDAPKPACVVGYEVSGTIDKLGEGVTDFTVGERVLGMTMFGGYAELVCTDARVVRAIPARMTDEEAAALPVVYLTAYHMLHGLTEIREGDRILIHAAAGGVGIAAVQMARAVNAEIFATASASKHDFLRGLGVQHCIDYNTQDFAAEVKRITKGEGVDIVMDALGGSGLNKSYASLRAGGRLFSFGFSAAAQGGKVNYLRLASEFLRIPKFHPMKMMGENRGVLGVNMNPLARHRPDLIGRELDGLLDLFNRGLIRPRVDKIVEAKEPAEAHRQLESRRNVGKVLLRFR